MSKKLEPFQKELNRIVKFLNQRATFTEIEQGEKLWDVLTALRGPDVYEAQEMKGPTTAVLRHAIGLTTGAYAVKGALIFPDAPGFVEHRKNMRIFRNNHFEHHIKTAFETMGLKWDELNPNTGDAE